MGLAALATVMPSAALADDNDPCTGEWIAVGFAATAVVAATAGVIANPGNPLAWASLASAVSSLEKAYQELVRCQVEKKE